jgi:sulfite reductase beta subunit-like hemoprotein
MATSVESQYDATVRQDIELFRSQAEAYLAGDLTDDQFRAVRLRRGIYGQRQPNVQMVRTKVPSGMVTSNQARQLARAAAEFGGGRAHLTTRQNVQYHFVPLQRVPDLLHLLADARLTTREACYNTVRNVTTCPFSGLSADELFDVRPYARRVAFAFLHKELTDNLPRKFKIAFEGCPHDHIGTGINDLGFRAVFRDGEPGFRVTVAGGLGPLPNEGRLLVDFLPVDRVVNLCEAVIRVFNVHGNRANKNKARLKFVLRERGFDWLKEAIEREYADILENGGIPMPDEIPEGFGGFLSHPPPLATGADLPVLGSSADDPAFDAWLETNVIEQHEPGYATIVVRVSQGNLSAFELRGLADLADQAGDGFLRFTMDQNVAIGYVPLRNLRRVYSALRMIGLAQAGAGRIDDVTTCPGAYSCNLALTKSMNLGEALAQMLEDEDDPAVRALSIKISGCPNSCGQHWIANIGLYGNARKIEGREVPYYQLLVGGDIDENGIPHFGLQVQSIPARLAPIAIARVLDHFRENREAGESFRDYVLRFKAETFRSLTAEFAKPVERFPELYKDWGDEVDFSLQLGRGECAS